MKRLIVLLLLFHLTNGYAQTGICELCKTLAESKPEHDRKEYWIQCFYKDSTMLDNSTYELRRKHKCKDFLWIELYTLGDTISHLSYSIDSEGNTIFMNSEKIPEFKGGMPAYKKYIAKTVHYPKTALRKNIEGRVEILLNISKTGEVFNARVLKGVEPSLDEEALRAVTKMPPWIPGEHKGEPVVYRYIVPIRFTIP